MENNMIAVSIYNHHIYFLVAVILVQYLWSIYIDHRNIKKYDKLLDRFHSKSLLEYKQVANELPDRPRPTKRRIMDDLRMSELEGKRLEAKQ